MNTGDVFFMVGHEADEGQGDGRPCIVIRIVREAENLCRPHVIAGDGKVDQKIPGKQVSPKSGYILVRVDEDIGNGVAVYPMYTLFSNAFRSSRMRR